VNKASLERGIETIVPGQAMFSYGSTVQDVVEKAGYKVIKHLTGHGVGVDVHERPYVFNRGHKDMKKQIFHP
jgi:methionyl aminopeptidase